MLILASHALVFAGSKINANPDDIVLVTNATTAIDSAASSFPLTKG